MHSLVRNAAMAIEKKNISQIVLDFNDYTSKINNRHAIREHRTFCTLLRAVSHQYLKNNTYHNNATVYV